MLDTTIDVLDRMVDGSEAGISVKPWDQYAQKWANITTLTPTITGNTMFQVRNPSSTYFNGEQTLIDLIHNEATWTNILYVKPFTIPSNANLNELRACLAPGDTIQIKMALNNSMGGKPAIGVSLLYTQSSAIDASGISMVMAS